MGKLTVETTPLAGVLLLTPALFGDERGYFTETYNERDFYEAGVTAHFVQDNQSKSSRGVLRGLHYQATHPQAKLVRVLSGEVFDVAVDLRPGSPTWGQWTGAVLSGDNHRQLFIPRGLAHGFLVLSETAVFAYKCDDFYHPEDEAGLAWNDPTVGIDWPITPDMTLLLSDKDKRQPLLR